LDGLCQEPGGLGLLQLVQCGERYREPAADIPASE